MVGDEVVATDPDTGQSGSRPVAELIRHGGQHTMVELAFEDGSVLTATDGHPFWDVSTGLFTDAIDLQAGELVLALDGSTLQVTAVRVYGEDLTAYNLEIAGIHTYYAGETPVLVHNSCGPDVDDSFQFASGGRGGANVKNLVGPPNTVARAAVPGRVFQTNDIGEVIFDITRDRVKPVIPGIGFVRGGGRKLTPSADQLSWIDQLWGS